MKKIKLINFDYFLVISLGIILIGHYLKITPGYLDVFLLTFFASIATFPILFSAYKSLRNKKISVDLLASIALIVSLINQEWASAVFINLMLTSARIFAAYTEKRSQNALRSLLKLRPEKVKVKRGEKILEESVSKIKKGDLIIIELGDRIPVDGTIVKGQAEIDQSSLTGESIPVSKKIGEKVFSSTLNVSGSLVIRAEKVGKNTTFEKLVKLVEESQKNKIGIKTIADKFTSLYIVITVIGTVLLYIFSHNISLILTVLLVTCADDIAVAIPMAFSAAIGSAAKKGIIVKGGEYFEGFDKVKTILFDKTGTLTKGKLKIEGIYSLDDYDEKEVLKLAAMADCFSEHPIAEAVLKYAEKQKVKFEKPDNFKEIPGLGSMAEYKGKTIICGREKIFKEHGVVIPKEQSDQFENLRKGGFSLLLVSYDKKLVGYVRYEDEIREEAQSAVENLRKLGVKRMVMLTGDNKAVAEKVAGEIKLDSFHANLLPEDKIKYVKKYVEEKNGKVAMIGDGINDAASLALSDIGVAMGAIGTDAAIEAADVALMKDDLSKVPEAMNLGKLATRIAHQDFVIWGILNTIGLALAFFRVIGPESAAAFNFVTDFIPIFNSLRIFRYSQK